MNEWVNHNIERVMFIIEENHCELMSQEKAVREALEKHDARMEDESKPRSHFYAHAAARRLDVLDVLLAEQAQRLERARAELKTLRKKILVD